MSAKICRNVIALAALAAVLSTAPVLAAGNAAGQRLRAARPESLWQVAAGFWSAAAHEVVSWWKQSQHPSQRNQSCQNGAVSCSSNPKPPGDVGSAIDPDGKP